MSKTVTITVIVNGKSKAITKKFPGNKMPDDLDQFINKFVGERPKHEERR